MADQKITAEGKKAEVSKPGKPEHKKKSRFIPAIKKFFRDFKGEFKKIIWPTKQTIVRNTAATLAMCAVIGLFVSLFDLGLSALIKLLLSL